MKKSIRISPAEWDVSVVVWERAPVAASVVTKVLSKAKGWSLTTVRTLLQRLVNKGVLKQQMEGKRYLYSPRIAKEELLMQESESFLSRVLGHAPSATVLHLVRKADLSPEDIRELRQILREKEK